MDDVPLKKLTHSIALLAVRAAFPNWYGDLSAFTYLWSQLTAVARKVE